MRIINIITLCLLFFLGSCEMTGSQGYYIPESEQAVGALLSKIKRSLEEKYRIKAIGTSISMPGGDVRELGLDFQIQGPLSREETREILIGLAHDFIAYVNSDERVRPYLKYYPFTVDNVDINLFFIDSKGYDLDDPYIGIAGIARGKLDYVILVTTDIPNIKSKFIESYEEALKALENN